MDTSKVLVILTGITALITAITPILLALIHRQQAVMVVNSEIAKQASAKTATRVELVRIQAEATAKKMDREAVAAEEVRAELLDQGVKAKTQMDEIARVANDTHTLVNSNMGVQLKLAAGFARRLADITKNPDDEQAAALAELALAEHLKKQAIVDSGTG